MLANIWTIYGKELKETLRDKRTLLFMVLLPTVLMPTIMKFTMEFVQKAEKKAASETIYCALIGGENLPQLEEQLSGHESFELVTLPEMNELDVAVIKQAIREERISLAIAIPKDAAGMMARGEQVPIDMFYDNASIVSKVKRRAAALIEEMGEARRDEQLAVLGVTSSIAREQLLEPYKVRDRGVAELREKLGEALGGMLPYFFIIFCFLGCLYPAIDLGAGEKERGTLETLLLVPVSRTQVVLGKFFVIFTCGVISSVLSVGSIGVWLLSNLSDMPPEVKMVLQSIGPLDYLLVGSMLIPVAAMFASMLLAISIFARSFKEAQAYATPLNIVVILPAVLAMLPGVELDWTWAMVPITNVALAVKELVKGTMDYTMFAVILGSSTVIAAGLLTFCTKWFEREHVLFRE